MKRYLFLIILLRVGSGNPQTSPSTTDNYFPQTTCPPPEEELDPDWYWCSPTDCIYDKCKIEKGPHFGLMFGIMGLMIGLPLILICCCCYWCCRFFHYNRKVVWPRPDGNEDPNPGELNPNAIVTGVPVDLGACPTFNYKESMESPPSYEDAVKKTIGLENKALDIR